MAWKKTPYKLALTKLTKQFELKKETTKEVEDKTRKSCCLLVIFINYVIFIFMITYIIVTIFMNCIFVFYFNRMLNLCFMFKSINKVDLVPLPKW
jgi:hypothetical protein